MILGNIMDSVNYGIRYWEGSAVPAVEMTSSLEAEIKIATLGVARRAQGDGINCSKFQCIIGSFMSLDKFPGLHPAMFVVIKLETSDDGPGAHSSGDPPVGREDIQPKYTGCYQLN